MKRWISLVALLALLTGACGDDDSSDAVASLEETTTTSTTDANEAVLDAEEAALAFAQCLRDEGLDVEDPEVDGEGQYHFRQIVREPGEAVSEQAQAALEVCEPIIEGIISQFRLVDDTAFADGLLGFAQCMRAGGLVDWPDPDPTWTRGSGDGSGGHIPGLGAFGDVDLDLTDPAQATVFDACRVEFNVGPQD